MKWVLTCVIFMFVFLGKSQVMNVGILHTKKVSRIVFTYNKGSYTIQGDAVDLGTMNYGSTCEISLIDGELQLKLNNELLGSYKQVRLIGDGVMNVTSKSPSARERKYQGSFTVSARSSRIVSVNHVSMENYLSGVLESEAGSGRHAEYYKVQSLMSRTYALKNLKRHKSDGFSVCDGIHCQAYHNMLRFTPEIRTAVRETKGEVLCNQRGKLVSTYFSANCGGQICDASQVWNTSVPHVETFKDTFCIRTKQATWTKSVSQSSWENFLVKKYGYPVGDSLMNARIYSFESEDRSAFYIHPSLGIPMRDLRSKFGLKSAYFSTKPVGNDVIITGRGFGHGVGLCQEGAMNMGEKGYNYRQIALYYFTGLSIRNYSEL